MAEKKHITVWIRILQTILSLLVVLVLAFVFWGSTPAKPMPEALTALQSDLAVTVETGKWLVFTPLDSQPEIGFIIYPGGRVDYRSYAPTAQAIADQGYLVVIIHMPLNLAVFDPNAAEQFITNHPEIKQWVIGGHSLGGAMAANYVYTHPGVPDGLILWAAYPASTNDLSGYDIQVVSISGTLDGLSTPAKIESSRGLLPIDSAFFPIEGGNHAQFGWYGPQSGDKAATISREVQQNQIVQATVLFLAGLK